MKVLFMEWEAYGSRDVEAEFDRRGFEVDKYWMDRERNIYYNPILEQELIIKLKSGNYDFVFSWNYIPVAAIACNVCRVPYAAWIYDSPVLALWHCSVVSPYNYIFIFDKADYLELKRKGINTVYYLPLAANVDRYDSYEMDEELEEIYSVPVSFIGSTYTENKFNDYRRLNRLDSYSKGYVDGLLTAQKGIYGKLVMEERLTPELVEKLQEASRVVVRENVDYTHKMWFGRSMLPKCVTAMERQEILAAVSEKYPFYLYTIKKTPSLPKAINRGMAGNRKEAVYIFRSSKINLNITLRSIRSGIPLRAFEVMGSGGFLLTNYQEDYLDYFEPGIDYVYYDSYEDLLEKIDYYLTHDEERQQIARNGYEKVKAYHTYRNRFDTILSIMKLDNGGDRK